MGGILCINLLRHSCTYICGGLILRYILFCPRLSLFPFFFFFSQRSLKTLLSLSLSSIASFFQRNGSTTFDGHFNMDTGTDDVANFGKVKKWNYRDTSKLFNSPCNVIEGSAGEFWPPYREKDEIVLFSGDLCRSVATRVSTYSALISLVCRNGQN